jgi:hypothetical protein
MGYRIQRKKSGMMERWKEGLGFSSSCFHDSSFRWSAEPASLCRSQVDRGLLPIQIDFPGLLRHDHCGKAAIELHQAKTKKVIIERKEPIRYQNRNACSYRPQRGSAIREVHRRDRQGYSHKFSLSSPRNQGAAHKRSSGPGEDAPVEDRGWNWPYPNSQKSRSRES